MERSIKVRAIVWQRWSIRNYAYRMSVYIRTLLNCEINQSLPNAYTEKQNWVNLTHLMILAFVTKIPTLRSQIDSLSHKWVYWDSSMGQKLDSSSESNWLICFLSEDDIVKCVEYSKYYSLYQCITKLKCIIENVPKLIFLKSIGHIACCSAESGRSYIILTRALWRLHG